jgi:hypothetical protein
MAPTCAELIANTAVEDGSDDASNSYFEGFHRVVSLDQILTVEISPLHSLTLGAEVGRETAAGDECNRLITTVKDFYSAVIRGIRG